MKIRNTSMTDLLTLGDNSIVNGYTATNFRRGARGRKRIVASAARVDYEFEVASSRTNVNPSLEVYVEATTAAGARTKVDALLDIVEEGPWVLDVYGDSTSEVWLCDPAETDPSESLDGRQWVLSLTFPARPAL